MYKDSIGYREELSSVGYDVGAFTRCDVHKLVQDRFVAFVLAGSPCSSSISCIQRARPLLCKLVAMGKGGFAERGKLWLVVCKVL